MTRLALVLALLCGACAHSKGVDSCSTADVPSRFESVRRLPVGLSPSLSGLRPMLPRDSWTRLTNTPRGSGPPVSVAITARDQRGSHGDAGTELRCGGRKRSPEG